MSRNSLFSSKKKGKALPPKWLVSAVAGTCLLAVVVLLLALVARESGPDFQELQAESDHLLTTGRFHKAAKLYTASAEEASTDEQRSQAIAHGELARQLAQIRRLGLEEERYSTALGLLTKIGGQPPWIAALVEAEKTALATSRARRIEELLESAGKSLKSGNEAAAFEALTRCLSFELADSDPVQRDLVSQVVELYLVSRELDALETAELGSLDDAVAAIGRLGAFCEQSKSLLLDPARWKGRLERQRQQLEFERRILVSVRTAISKGDRKEIERLRPEFGKVRHARAALSALLPRAENLGGSPATVDVALLQPPVLKPLDPSQLVLQELAAESAPDWDEPREPPARPGKPAGTSARPGKPAGTPARPGKPAGTPAQPTRGSASEKEVLSVAKISRRTVVSPIPRATNPRVRQRSQRLFLKGMELEKEAGKRQDTDYYRFAVEAYSKISQEAGRLLYVRSQTRAGRLLSYELQDYSAAVPHYEQALRKDPRHPIVYYELGYASYQLGRYEEAIESLSKAGVFAAINPEEIDDHTAFELHSFFLAALAAEARSTQNEKELLFLRDAISAWRSFLESCQVNRSRCIDLQRSRGQVHLQRLRERLKRFPSSRRLPFEE